MTKRLTDGGFFLTILMVVTMLGAAPAGAHHKDGHDQGNDRGSESSDDNNDSSDDKGGGHGQERTDADPEPTKTEPSNKGPADCDPYNDKDKGTYDHDSCDGTQGEHGNGGNGRCAGCTGKADDKSPPGQSRNDHNNGYECDHNGGVGKGNPPHARCPKDEGNPPNNPPRRNPPRRNRNNPPDRPTPTPSPSNIPAPPGPVVNPGGINICDKDNNMANGIQKCDNVLGIRFGANPGRPPEAPVANPAAVLPFTGLPVGAFLLLGAAFMTIGAVLLRLRERRSPQN